MANIPGFNAEASFYRSGERYTSQQASFGGSQTLVQPAHNYGCILGCMNECMYSFVPGCLQRCTQRCPEPEKRIIPTLIL